MVDTPRPEGDSSADPQPSIRGRAGKLHRTAYTLSEEETQEFGRTLARTLKAGDLLLLEGDLGLGKTVLVRGIAAGLGIAVEDVSSPSFTLVQELSHPFTLVVALTWLAMMYQCRRDASQAQALSEEAARDTGIPLGSLKRYLREGLAALREQLARP